MFNPVYLSIFGHLVIFFYCSICISFAFNGLIYKVYDLAVISQYYYGLFILGFVIYSYDIFCTYLGYKTMSRAKNFAGLLAHHVPFIILCTPKIIMLIIEKDYFLNSIRLDGSVGYFGILFVAFGGLSSLNEALQATHNTSLRKYFLSPIMLNWEFGYKILVYTFFPALSLIFGFLMIWKSGKIVDLFKLYEFYVFIVTFVFDFRYYPSWLKIAIKKINSNRLHEGIYLP